MPVVHAADTSSPTHSTERSFDSVASGMAWAPEHMQAAHRPAAAGGDERTSGQAVVGQERVPGAYMHTRSLGHLALELDKTPLTRPLKGPAAQPLGNLLQEITRMSMLFCGRAIVGQWRKTRQCSGDKLKKEVTRRLDQCTVLGIDDGLERCIVTGKPQDLNVKDTGRFAVTRCTRLVCLPGVGFGPSVAPMDLTNCKDVKCKGSGPRMRVEIMHADGRSLWLYDVGLAEYRAITESLSSARSYSQEKSEKETEQASMTCDLPLNAAPLGVENSGIEQKGSQINGSPSKHTPVPKLDLHSIVNDQKPSAQSVQQSAQSDPLQVQQGEKAPAPNTKEAKPARRDIAVARPAHRTAEPVSVSSAVRAAEALIYETNGVLDDVVTATTGHVYVQGGTADSYMNPISRIKPEQLEAALQSAGPNDKGKNRSGAKQGAAPLPPPIGTHTQSAGFRPNSGSHAQQGIAQHQSAASRSAGQQGAEWRVVPRVSAAENNVQGGGAYRAMQETDAGSPAMANGPMSTKNFSPPPRRLPRLNSMSPQKPIQSDANDIQTALANVRAAISPRQISACHMKCMHTCVPENL